jgi:thioredoxin-dependent peroxiredoxin
MNGRKTFFTIVTIIFSLSAAVAFGQGTDSGGLKMQERTGLVVARGNPLTLLGNPVKVGDTAPGFTVVGNDMQPVDFSAYKGKLIVLSAVPSLDTPVCNAQTHKFNDEATKLGDKVVILTISMDLPFAQKRWCGAEGVDRVTTLSDYRERSFGLAYGLLIKESKLLARSVFIVDKEGKVRYEQIVKELTTEPDYADVLAALKNLL